jgi:predicted nucleic acid-binding Zn ribbon protein
MTERKGKPEKIGDALAAYLDKAGLADRVEQATIIPEWEHLVGPQIATVTRPLMISRDGTLFVAVLTNAWMQELSLMEPQLLSAVNAQAGRRKVSKIRWRLMQQ